MLNKMVDVGVISEESGQSLLTKIKPSNQNKKKVACHRHRFADKHKYGKQPPSQESNEEFRQCMAKLPRPFRRKGRKGKAPHPPKEKPPSQTHREQKTEEQEAEEESSFFESIDPLAALKRVAQHILSKRDVESIETNEDGSRSWNISCIERGEAEEADDSNVTFVALCNMCWTIRELSSQYFPRFINELSCDSTDNSCLSGHGQCRSRRKLISVLRNLGTDEKPDWQKYTLSTSAACECKVVLGSALEGFVSE